ncbi:MAG: DegT/DnrJ/EryC1/StrS family aminotransferase [Balneolaceae bacterium]|nr:DegT/DnrJ/EryC1/StrS family aminotransferase [Balneolaceae bacterium]
MSSDSFIPILNLTPELDLLRDELDRAYREVMDHGRFIMGPEVKQFEESVAKYVGVKHAIGVNSGTDALVIALRAAGIGEGDEVITTSFTFFATTESIDMVGATSVFADINESTFNIDPSDIEEKITERTKAILPVHLYGRPAAMARIMEIAERHNLIVIEDCAQSFGAVYSADCTECGGNCDASRKKIFDGIQTGSIGHAGAFSFFPSKNLGGFGDGGMITTNSDEMAELCRKLRAHGSLKKYRNEVMGYNSRLDTLQAALLNVKLPHIDRFNENRRAAARRYTDAFAGSTVITPPALPDDGHVYHQYTIRVAEGKRDELAGYLQRNDIGSMIYYPIPCHKLPVYEGKYDDLTLPVTNRLTDEVLSLPIGPFLSEEDQERVIRAVMEFSTS